MIQKDSAVAAVAEERSPEPSYVRWGFNPARRLCVELSQTLKLSILPFRKNRDAHGGSDIYGAVLRLVLFSRVQSLAVITNAPAAQRTLRGAIAEDVSVALLSNADDVRLTACPLHLIERP